MASVYEVARVHFNDHAGVAVKLSDGYEPFAVYDEVVWLKKAGFTTASEQIVATSDGSWIIVERED